MALKTCNDPKALLTLVTGNDWAPWITNHIRAAKESLHLSYYMVSPHWRSPETAHLDLVTDLADAAARIPVCRLIVDQPNVAFTTRPFNVRAATKLAQAGWKVRVMPDKRTLHEKIFLADKRITLIGSHNISRSSAITNYDTSVAIESEDFAALVYRQFWERWRLGTTLEV